MKKQVLFIQGAGPGAYQVDGKLAASLQDALGPDYNVRYPRMPGEEAPDYGPWKTEIAKELAALDTEAVLVGHSLGGSILLKYLAEEKVATPVAGIFLVAAPYWGGDEDWQYEGFTLQEGFAGQLPGGAQIFLYHCRDDGIVPFAHLALYAAKLPWATTRVLEAGGHQCNNDLSEVARDIKHVIAPNGK